MTLKEAIEVLRRHNRWRRGDDSVTETNPKLLGETIDTIIKEFDEGYFTTITDVFPKLNHKEDTQRQVHGILGIIEEALVQVSVSDIFIGRVDMDDEHRIELANTRYELLNHLWRVHEYFNEIVSSSDEEYDTDKKI